MALAILFGLAFAGLGVTFNLAFHASSRPIGSADILQGLALSGIAVAGCRRVIGKNPWAFSGLAVLAASWWAIGSTWPSFPGSQYLYPTTGDPLSLFPALPWLSLAAWGAVLAQVSALRCVGLAIGLGVASAVGWDHVSPFGPPVKFPLNATYAMLGGSLAATTFAVAKLARSWKRIATLGTWLGRRWLVFFYVHLGIAEGLRRVGLTDPVACWAALGSLSIAATWMVSAIMDRLRSPFRHPATWAAMGLATVGVGLVPSLPALAVSLVAGSLGLFFAAHYDELAGLILGPALDENSSRSGSPSENLTTRYLVKVAFIVVALLAPELCRRLPVPIGVAPLESTESEPRPTPKTEGR